VARIGVSITKSTPFRNSTQEFSNVYYYESTSGGHPNQTDAEGIIDTIVAREKVHHASGVTFVRGRLWSQVGSPGQNEMIFQKNLSGTGAAATDASMDKERAFLFRVRAGVDTRGQPVYLRKWFHWCGGGGIVSLNTTLLSNSGGLTSTQRQSLVAAVNNMLSLTQGGQTWELVAKSGRAYNLPAQMSAHEFLEHHQMGDQWRAQ
jgi:hypothetical protein